MGRPAYQAEPRFSATLHVEFHVERLNAPIQHPLELPRFRGHLMSEPMHDAAPPDALERICHQADQGLWTAYARGSDRGGPGAGSGRLVFPVYRGGSRRVSEQEARFAFVEALPGEELLYAVEAPTTKLYQFTGQTPMSAQTDLALFDASGTRLCNVEFKAKGVGRASGKRFALYKDLQKLLREPYWGLWFHVLHRVNNSTLGELLGALGEETVRVLDEFPDKIESPGLSIHVCVLHQGFSIHQAITGSYLSAGILQDRLALDITVSRGEIRDVLDSGSWVLKQGL